MRISFIMPGRNNLKYAKWSYNSIRKNQGEHEVEICFADDASTDGTWEWCLEMMNQDPLFKAIRNDTGKRAGHTILYDQLVNEVCTNDMAMIWHCDMYLCPGALDAVEKHMYSNGKNPHIPLDSDWSKPENQALWPNKGIIVSLTRIEPPLHPPGLEKLLQDFGTEPGLFDESKLLEFVDSQLDMRTAPGGIITTKGVFAPWAFWVEDFKEVHGHDPLYAPQSKEDSDIFNKFALNEVEFIQTWEGFVYHMTCRGSRFNPNITQVGQNSSEWNAQNIKSSRNFIRKWGHFVKHDKYLKPIVPNKYDIGILVENANLNIIHSLEPWCSTLYVSTKNDDSSVVDQYIELEQRNTFYDLSKRVQFIDRDQIENTFENSNNDVTVKIDANQMSADYANVITNLSEILADSGKIGRMEFNLMEFNIKKLDDYKYSLLDEQNNIEGVR